MMKAWLAETSDEGFDQVVFAESSFEAQAKLVRHLFGSVHPGDYNINVHRMPVLDKCYSEGKWLMSWDDPQIRLILVRDEGFHCAEVDPGECSRCIAAEYCQEYQEEEYYEGI